MADCGAAQSRQRNGAWSDGTKGILSASASSASCASRSSRMRRKRIHVSSGTYFIAPAQFERRITSQMDLTAAFSDCCVPWRLPVPLDFSFAISNVPAENFAQEVGWDCFDAIEFVAKRDP